MNENIYINLKNTNQWIQKCFDRDLVSIEELLGVIEDLGDELEHWKEKYEDLEQDLQDNYKPISHFEEYGISESDFH